VVIPLSRPACREVAAAREQYAVSHPQAFADESVQPGRVQTSWRSRVHHEGLAAGVEDRLDELLRGDLGPVAQCRRVLREPGRDDDEGPARGAGAGASSAVSSGVSSGVSSRVSHG
jgi:hypothetical protein